MEVQLFESAGFGCLFLCSHFAGVCLWPWQNQGQGLQVCLIWRPAMLDFFVFWWQLESEGIPCNVTWAGVQRWDIATKQERFFLYRKFEQIAKNCWPKLFPLYPFWILSYSREYCCSASPELKTNCLPQGRLGFILNKNVTLDSCCGVLQNSFYKSCC